MSKLRTSVLLLFTISGTWLCRASAISDEWIGGSGNWSNPANWTAGSPNGSNYSASIGSGGLDQVTLDVSFAIDSLQVGGATGHAQATSGVDSQQFGVGSLNVTSQGMLSLHSGDIMTAGNAGNAGEVDVQGTGTALNVTGNITNTGSIYQNSILNVGGTLTNQHLLNVGGTGVANINQLNNIGHVGIETGATLNITGGGTGVTDIASGISYTVAGAFNVINGGNTSSAIANLASVEGTLELQNGHSNTLAALTNSGEVDIQLPGTALNVTGNITNTGSIYQNSILNVRDTLTNQHLLNVGGTGTVSASTIENAGTVRVESSAGLLVGADSSTPAGYVQLADGTLAELIASDNSFGTIFVDGPVKLDGALEAILQEGFLPTAGQEFTILSFTPGSLTGQFSSIVNNRFEGGQWSVDYDNAAGKVVLVAGATGQSATPEPATILMAVSGGLMCGLFSRLRRS